MRNSVLLFRSLTLASILLVASVGLADAKKKKPAAEPDCAHVQDSSECGDTGLQLQGDQPDEPSAPEGLASKTESSAMIPSASIPKKNSTNQIANASAAAVTEEEDISEWYIGTMPDQPYDIPLVDHSKMDPKFERQEVAYSGKGPVGSIIVDIDHRFLYFIESQGKAIRYGIGVGRLGFSWHGDAIIGRKGIWPHWTPTETMRKILPNLPAGMDGGVDSPLGARAMYLYQDGRDIMFRIHGTNEPWSIGERVSSGCVRLLNEDIADLYGRVKIGTRVFVRNSKHVAPMKPMAHNISG